MPLNEKTKFRASLVAALGTATFVAIGVSAQTGGTGGAPGVSASASPTATPTTSPTVSPTASPMAMATPTSTPGTTAAAATSTRQVYSAVLNPANGSGASGTVSVVVDQGRVGAMVQASGLAPNVMHEMHIHRGTACSDITADVNGDGIVDPIEAEAVSGAPIIPLSLSGDLALATPQAAANQTYPIAAADGLLNYINAGSSTFLNNLPSPNATASPGGIAATPAFTPSGAAGSANLTLSGRVVEIHGISPSAVLPNTAVSDVAGLTPQQTLGVACGVLVPVTE